MWIAKANEQAAFESAPAIRSPADGVSSLTLDFEELFNEHAPFMYRTAYGVTGRHEDAEDVVQTIFVRLLGRDLPAALTVNPKAYLYRAAVNVALDAVRRRRRQIPVDGLTEPSTADNDQSLDDHRWLYAAIAALKPSAAEILVLRYVHDKSDSEIARMLGVSRGTIALRLFRTRARLKKLLRARLGDRS